ncbi:MAG: hypothetical protein R3Y06_03635 [Faecalibacterium sp.]
MKKLRYFLAIVILLAISTACGQEEESQANSIASVNDVISSQMALKDSDSSDSEQLLEQDSASSDSAQDAQEENAEAAETDGLVADVDLTELSATMIYAEIYNMVTMPLVYHGKTVKVTGYYDEYYDVMSDTLYCSLFVMDALACCAQGLSVEFGDDYVYPDDYPEDGAEITIYATFEIYYPEPGNSSFYYHLVDTIVIE